MCIRDRYFSFFYENKFKTVMKKLQNQFITIYMCYNILFYITIIYFYHETIRVCQPDTLICDLKSEAWKSYISITITLNYLTNLFYLYSVFILLCFNRLYCYGKHKTFFQRTYNVKVTLYILDNYYNLARYGCLWLLL